MKSLSMPTFASRRVTSVRPHNEWRVPWGCGLGLAGAGSDIAPNSAATVPGYAANHNSVPPSKWSSTARAATRWKTSETCCWTSQSRERISGGQNQKTRNDTATSITTTTRQGGPLGEKGVWSSGNTKTMKEGETCKRYSSAYSGFWNVIALGLVGMRWHFRNSNGWQPPDPLMGKVRWSCIEFTELRHPKAPLALVIERNIAGRSVMLCGMR